MSNVLFNGADVFLSSGGSAVTMARVDRVQDVRVDYQLPRTQVGTIGRFAPLPGQQVINYTPGNVSLNYMMGNKDVPRNLGILNSTGVAVQIGQGTTVPTWGARNIQIKNAPVTTTNYAGQWDVVTGVLKSFSLQGSVGDAVRGSFSLEALDVRQVPNTSAREIPTYSGQLVTPENENLGGTITFEGLGYSGLLVQSFNFQLTFDHAQTFCIGTKYPEKRTTSAAAALTLSAFISGGVNNQLTSLTGFDIGTPIAGTCVLSLQPACSAETPLLITATNPYLLSQNIGVQVGNFTQIDIGLGIPLSIIPFECTGGALPSNVTMT